MRAIEEFADQRQKAWCVHCGCALIDTDVNRDHVPSRALLLEPYPENLPCIGICRACNEGFSQDEEYTVALLSTVLAGTTDPGCQAIPAAARILGRSSKLRERIDRARAPHAIPGGAARPVWMPEVGRVERVILKNARGHALFEHAEPLLDDPARIWFAPIQSMAQAGREAFEQVETGGFWPEVGSRMFTRVITGHDLADGWVVVQPGVYRYSVRCCGTVLVRSVLFEYLATEVRWDD